MADRRRLFELYERAAQSPERQARFLRALAGESARTFGEDFCGTGALSVAWAQRSGDHVAVATDHDSFPLGILCERAGDADVAERVRVIEGDVCDTAEQCDVIGVFNFSIGYFHNRADLLVYLRHAHRRLAPGGVFVCDFYGGADQFALGESELDLGEGVRYIWEQRTADPLTSRVTNAMHFETDSGERYEDAFLYDWRLWSPAELADAFREAGFSDVDFYDRLGDGLLDDGSVLVTPVSGDELDENFVVYAAGRA